MDSSSTSSRHLRTHLIFSEFDRHSENNFNEITNRNSSFRRRNCNNNNENCSTNCSSNNNNNNCCNNSDFHSTAIADPGRSMAPSPASLTVSGKNRRAPRSWEELSLKNSRPPDDAFVEMTRANPDNVENNNRRPHQQPFIQISCPRQTDNQTLNGGDESRSSRSHSWKSGCGSSTSSPQSSHSRTTPPVPGRHGYLSTPSNLRKVLTNGKIEQVQEDCFIIPAHRMGTFLPISLVRTINCLLRLCNSYISSLCLIRISYPAPITSTKYRNR